ncbi:transglycosylase domain-containing protein [Microtetraspora sp. NBRC 16547]|uniref:transglycosylase domain-containing protein n=1 Tax=Microtetraspora sp. NBRC 16547 TaxID=3030993 RepID=UPI0024A0C327|nr:transglycosylase domain-containing protein [Microtetraspora sp. NBRC 16547]GLW97330.1 carboxypeptidase [Microtetraspora sp. NBRC 16547]
MTFRLAYAGALGTAGALGGVLVATLVLPVVGGVGVAAKEAARTFTDQLPAPPEDPLPEMTRVLDRHGKQIAQFYIQNRESVPIDRIAPVMRQAIVAIEDARFYEHGALDARGTFRALVTNAQAGGIRQGGSSLTQQLVKNLLVNHAETDQERQLARVQNLDRKINELRYALALERKYTKDQILERYLNIAYFGAGAFGIQAAAQRFFGVNASRLTLPQAATLAGAVRTPYNTDPTLGAKQRQALRERRDLVLERMAELGVIRPAAARTARSKPLGLNMQAAGGGCGQSRYPYFCLYVQHEILTNPAFGYTAADRERTLRRGGLVLHTTLDPRTQRSAERAIAARVAPADTEVAAEAMVEPGTGRIRALAASKGYGRNPGNRKNGPNTTYNLPADQAHGGGLGFQAGSTFKAFTLATALSQGWRFGEGFETPGRFVPREGYTNCSGKPVNDPRARIYNAGGEGSGGGPYSLELGTWNSVNIFFMKLERKVGLCNVVNTARKLGITRADGAPLQEVPTFTLGVNEMDPTTVAGAFAAFAARGRYCRPVAITEIVERDGTRVPIRRSCSRALQPEVADAVNHVLQGVFARGTMRGQSIGRPAAGKTGTNNGYTSAWFAGYTPDLAAAVSVGDMRGSYRYPLTGVTIGGEYYGSVQGASLPGPIWVNSMIGSLRRTPPSQFVRPDMARFGGGFTPGLKELLEAQRKKAREARLKARHRRLHQRGAEPSVPDLVELLQGAQPAMADGQDPATGTGTTTVPMTETGQPDLAEPPPRLISGR